MNNIRVFGLSSTKEFAQDVAHHLGVELALHSESYFDDREPFVCSNVNVRGHDVYVIQSLYDDEKERVAEKFLKLLIFIGSLKDASAKHVTCVVPYLFCQRQDRKTESREPITTKYIAKMLESAGVDRLLTMDCHNLSALQNSFRIPTDNLEAKNLLADHIFDGFRNCKDLVVLSPDSGGMSRARRFRQSLEKRLKQDVGLAYLDKMHYGRVIHGNEIIGNIKNKNVIVIDDMISSGSTLVECDKAIQVSGGKLLVCCATHGLFVGKASENLSSVRSVIVCDTIKNRNFQNVHMISTAKIFGQAIRRTHEQGGSISDLLKD